MSHRTLAFGLLAFSLLAIVIVLSKDACAGTTGCSDDLSGTVPTTPGYDLKPSDPCLRCRELNAFPHDFLSDAWNYVQTGHGSFVYKYYYETLSGHSAQTRFNVRTCSTLGQCADTLILTTFDTLGISVQGLPLQKRTGVQSWKLITYLPDGRQHTRTYYPEVVDESAPFPVPAPGPDDGYEPGTDCLTNSGVPRTGPRPTSYGGTITTTPVDPYAGGFAGGVTTLTCYRIVTRDGTGKIIGDVIRCVS